MSWVSDFFKPDVPKESPELRALTKEVTELARQNRSMIEQQAEENRLFTQFFAQQEGFDVDIDPVTGAITGIREISTPERERDKEIRGLMQERSLAALKGELPVDPALERSLKEQETELRNRLVQQFGPGYETSSAGIETLGEFYRTSEGLREGARTGQLTLAEQLGLTREQQEMFRRGTAQDVFRQFGVADPLTFAGALGQSQQGYMQAMLPYQQQQAMQFAANQAGMANMANFAGKVVGAGAAIATGRPPGT